MIYYVGKRLLLTIPVALGVTTMSFLLMHLSSGDPAITFLGNHATPDAVAALRHQWGLDRPLWEQYVSFLGGIVRGDLGTSLSFQTPITGMIVQRLPLTILLMIMATVISVAVAVPLAILAAVHKDSVTDEAVRIFNALAQGMPVFWVGTMLIIFLALKARMFPVGGYGDTMPEHLVSLILPAVSISLGIIPPLVRSLRSAMIEALSSEYVAFGRSKGLNQNTVLLRYALRNSSISGISILGVNVGGLAGGALVVENVFALPGMGTTLMQGILNRDFPVVQASTLVFGAVVVVVYLITDITYSFLNPRVRFA